VASTLTQGVKARYWEAPLMARYFGLLPSGLFSHAYIAAGVEYRHVGLVRDRNRYQYADGEIYYDQTPATPNLTNQFGYVAGLGMRLIDDATKIRVMPEVRFIRWQGTTFQGPGYRSAANQLEIGVGVSY
jgi:hypothetical protein